MAKKNRTAESWGATPSEPFVSVLKPTLQEPAWKALPYGARCLYITLKSFFNGANNGRIYLGVRKAAKELGAAQSSTERWFRDLQDFGFIRPTQGAFLGMDGRASATYWRLTELGYMGERPTREYKEWQPVKNKTPHRKSVQTVPKIGTPRTENRDTCTENRDGLSENPPPERTDFRCIDNIPWIEGGTGQVSNPPVTSPAERGRSAPTGSAVASPRVTPLLRKPSLAAPQDGEKAA
ncbi:MAG: hypothetical protein ACOZAM_15740 [Pseudomonadota bacterium]